MALQFPKGKYVSLVKVGEKGQVVIPKGVREMFDIQPGDNLLLMADIKRGIALVSVAAEEVSAPPELFEIAKLTKEDGNENSDG